MAAGHRQIDDRSSASSARRRRCADTRAPSANRSARRSPHRAPCRATGARRPISGCAMAAPSSVSRRMPCCRGNEIASGIFVPAERAVHGCSDPVRGVRAVDRRVASRSRVRRSSERRSAIDPRRPATCTSASVNTSTSTVKRPPRVTEVEVQRTHPYAWADLRRCRSAADTSVRVAVEHPAAPRLEHRRNARFGGAREAAARRWQWLRSERAASPSDQRRRFMH